MPQSVSLAPHPFEQAYVVPEGEQFGVDAGQVIPHAPQLGEAWRLVVHPADPLPEQYVQPPWQEDVGTLHVPPLQVALPVTCGSVVQSVPHAPQLCTSPRHPALHACPGHAASTATSRSDVPVSATVPVSVPAPVSVVTSTVPVSALESCWGPLSTGDV